VVLVVVVDEVVPSKSVPGALEKVRWVELHYTDLTGRLRVTRVAVPSVPSTDAIVARVDGSSVGMAPIERSDLLLVADESTLRPIPWFDGYWRAISDIYVEWGIRHPCDPRYVTQGVEEYFDSQGLRPLVGVEVEFFVFKEVRLLYRVPIATAYRLEFVDRSFGKGLDSNYHTVGEVLDSYLSEVALVLGKYFDVDVRSYHHEVASSQVELSLGAKSPKALSDGIQTVKYVAKSIASVRGLKATFMPKPIYGENGSGMHVHVSLWRGSTNVFHDPNDEYGISQLARYFIGGLLSHSRALAAIVAPTVNSYKRLVPGYEAPVYATWGPANRSAMVRVPKVITPSDARVEFRPPDPSSNPYLAIAAILLAGLDGIRKSIDPGEPIKENTYDLHRFPRERTLPRSLGEALNELASDNDFLKPVFTRDLLEAYMEIKFKELEEVLLVPTPTEFFKYLDV
jgi:glutamine synthetase